MDFLIVTGMSGAGKSCVANALEDLGYYCVDNIPPALINKFSEICMQSKGHINHIAFVVDSRGGELFTDLLSSLEELGDHGSRYQILFLDCSDTKIVTRYKETRRKHPLCDETYATIEDAIHLERKLLEPARRCADYIVDTTLLTTNQLREKVQDIFSDNRESGMLVNCMSFGFKHGLPSEADLVFDVRCLPNPFYIPELRSQTGEDAAVESYVLRWPDAQTLLQKLKDLLEYLVPLYIKEGKSQLMIAIGCTGGHHRSVVFARHLSAFLSEKGFRVMCSHRDCHKPQK